MIYRLLLSSLMLASVLLCHAQGPQFDQSDLLTMPYEDLSDLLRRYPGMYPMDFGTLGAPLILRPWNGHPWNLQTTRDGIPQNRRYDGLYDSNLQPASELQAINFQFLSGNSAGRFDLSTRSLSLDSPYTEFQIREGYYGYGTVDFAHGQRAYRSLTVQLTGRLGWYNGLRDTTASRMNRVRGQIGFDLGDLWRSEIIYGGSNNEGEDVARIKRKAYSERSEGILAVQLKDSTQALVRPHLKLFMRQDREKWGGGFHAWEQSGGWVFGLTSQRPRQSVQLKHMGMISDMVFPGVSKRRELSLDLAVTDSLYTSVAAFELFGGIARESGWQGSSERDQVFLSRCGTSVETRSYRNFSLNGGIQYAEQSVPVLWRNGSYTIEDRPLFVDPAFSVSERRLFPGNITANDVDRYVSSSVGIRWQRHSARIDLQGLSIHRPGHFENRFTAEDSDIRIVREHRDRENTQLGMAASAVVPLWYGLRIDSWWFAQADAEDLSTATDWRGYSRLYFERQFFRSHLTVRSHISYEEIGRRQGFSDYGYQVLGPNRLVGFRLSATIRGVTLVWGTENFFKEYYSILPGYTMIAKEEYLVFIWRLWL